MLVREKAKGDQYYVRLTGTGYKLDLKYESESSLKLSMCIQKPLTADAACTELLPLTENAWYYITLRLTDEVVNTLSFYSASGTERFPLTLNLDGLTSLDLFLGLTTATFKEVKLFAYLRPGAGRYLAHSQADAEKERLEFYYPLDGKMATRHFYNALDPTASAKKLVVGGQWIENAESVICPKGFYYTNSYPSCIKQTQLTLESTTSTPISLYLDSDEYQLILLSTWIYATKTNDPDMYIVDLGKDVESEMKIEGVDEGIKVSLRGNGKTLSVPVVEKGWVHVACVVYKENDEFPMKAYVNALEILSHSSNISPIFDSNKSIPYLLKQIENLKELHLKIYKDTGVRNLVVAGYKNKDTFGGLAEYFSDKLYPGLTTDNRNVVCYVPGISLDSSNKLILFRYKENGKDTTIDKFVGVVASYQEDPGMMWVKG